MVVTVIMAKVSEEIYDGLIGCIQYARDNDAVDRHSREDIRYDATLCCYVQNRIHQSVSRNQQPTPVMLQARSKQRHPS